MGPGGYTWQETIDGVVIVGFVERGPADEPPEISFDRDYAELSGRLAMLREAEEPRFTVVDFTNYRMTGHDNGRAVIGLVLRAHRCLAERGGGLCVCNHPVQLNPDFQGIMHLDRVIGIYGSRGEAMDAAGARQRTGGGRPSGAS